MLIIEDGTGVPDADAYISLADADALHVSRDGAAWAGTDPDKEAAIRRATAFVDTLRFMGRPAGGRAQSLAWPRENAFDADGFEISLTELPEEIKTAAGILAFAELASPGLLFPEVNRAGLFKRQRVGPIEVEFAGNPASVEFQRTVVTAAMDLLTPLTIGRGVKFVGRA
ncbi:MAG: hypothetical protein RQ826_13440 [Xanthomonadales bacterium]|nr:hypothetical protein [Xanthomonadales bacterium]